MDDTVRQLIGFYSLLLDNNLNTKRSGAFSGSQVQVYLNGSLGLISVGSNLLEGIDSIIYGTLGETFLDLGKNVFKYKIDIVVIIGAGYMSSYVGGFWQRKV